MQSVSRGLRLHGGEAGPMSKLLQRCEDSAEAVDPLCTVVRPAGWLCSGHWHGGPQRWRAARVGAATAASMIAQMLSDDT